MMRAKLVASLRQIFGVSCWLVAFGLICGAGCTVKYEGPSSRTIKRELQCSYLMRSARIFYPKGEPKNPADLPILGTKQVQEIQRAFSDVAGAVKRMHAKHAPTLSRFFERPIPGDLQVRARVTNVGAPIAEIEAKGRLSVDVRVAQALYRTAVVAGMKHVLSRRAPFGLTEDGAGDKEPTEAELLKQFFEVVQRVNELEAGTLAGDLWGVWSDDPSEGRWFSAMEVALLSQAINNYYVGPILFMISHEIGHQVLGHFDQSRLARGDCASFDALEYEADAYAVMLFSLETASALGGGVQGAWMQLAMEDLLGLEAQSGFASFFNYTYDFSGFRNVKPEGCRYPDPSERRSRAQDLRDTLRSGSPKLTWRQVLESYRAKPQAADE